MQAEPRRDVSAVLSAVQGALSSWRQVCAHVHVHVHTCMCVCAGRQVVEPIAYVNVHTCMCTCVQGGRWWSRLHICVCIYVCVHVHGGRWWSRLRGPSRLRREPCWTEGCTSCSSCASRRWYAPEAHTICTCMLGRMRMHTHMHIHTIMHTGPRGARSARGADRLVPRSPQLHVGPVRARAADTPRARARCDTLGR